MSRTKNSYKSIWILIQNCTMLRNSATLSICAILSFVEATERVCIFERVDAAHRSEQIFRRKDQLVLFFVSTAMPGQSPGTGRAAGWNINICIQINYFFSALRHHRRHFCRALTSDGTDCVRQLWPISISMFHAGDIAPKCTGWMRRKWKCTGA